MKEIILTQGKVALVDDEDYEFLNQWKWYASKHGNTYYAIRNLPTINGKRTSVKMHRVILGIDNSKIGVDHVDHCGINNQKSNIRIATLSQNLSNMSKRKNTSSKYIGVSLWTSKYKNKVYNRWLAQISKGRVKKFLGSYKSEEEAAVSYNKAAIEIHGEFANLNKIA